MLKYKQLYTFWMYGAVLQNGTIVRRCGPTASIAADTLDPREMLTATMAEVAICNFLSIRFHAHILLILPMP